MHEPSASGAGGESAFGRAGILEAILESASQSILAVKRDGVIVAANRRVEEMFGYAPEELVGGTVERLVPEGMRARHEEVRGAYFESPKVRPMGAGLELSARRKDGTEFPVEISLSYVSGGQGPLAIAFVTDITERKRLEEQLLQSQKMEAVGRLAGGIAHDFNNLLTVILGFNELMLRQISPLSPVRGCAEEIQRAGGRAAALTRQLLAFGRRQMARPGVLDVNEAMRKTEEMLRRLLGEQIELRYRLSEEPLRVMLDPTQLDQVTVNLLVNARDAMADGGTVTVQTSAVELDEGYARTHTGVKPGPYVQIAVSDEGDGIDAETQRHVFEPFFSTKEGAENSGLGLATVYGIVKQNGGDIWLYSEAGVGTTFKVYLPRVEEREESGDEAPRRLGEHLRGTETVMVVEDEDGVKHLMRALLEKCGYRVLAEGHPRKALEASRREEGEIALLITDVVMPEMNGPELARRMTEERPGLRVLYISGYTESMTLRQGVLASEANFMEKPFSLEKLLEKVREILEGE